jgi:hypothetical protein
MCTRTIVHECVKEIHRQFCNGSFRTYVHYIHTYIYTYIQNAARTIEKYMTYNIHTYKISENTECSYDGRSELTRIGAFVSCFHR